MHFVVIVRKHSCSRTTVIFILWILCYTILVDKMEEMAPMWGTLVYTPNTNIISFGP